MVCPLCGAIAVDEDGPRKLPSCHHLKFVYANGEAFEYAADGLEDWLGGEEVRAEKNEDLDEYDVWEALKRYLEPTGHIVEKSYSDMACGPIKMKIWAGYSDRV